MKHPIRSFFLSLGFLGLAGLAFNPDLVIKIQDEFDLSPENTATDFRLIPDEGADVLPPQSPPLDEPISQPVLPKTRKPNEDNLPRIAGFEKIAKNDPWIGSSPCGIEIFDAPKRLRGLSAREAGPFLTEPLSTSYNEKINNQPTSLYKSGAGITLRLVQPLIKYYDVSGASFTDAQNDLFDREPLVTLRKANPAYSPEIYEKPKVSEFNGVRRSTVAGDIFSPTLLSSSMSGSQGRFRIDIDNTTLTSAFLVTLPRWENYQTAPAADKSKWDDFLCNVAHHELGHLRIRLDITAETLDGYANLPRASSFKDMQDLINAYRKDVGAHIQDRQDAYHVYNGGGSRRGMVELPYADLPFPWLETESQPAQEN